MSPHGVPAMLAPMDGRVPVILCVDVEPDDHVYAPEDPSPWRGFELLAERMEELRGTLGDITGETARFSWFLRMDPQIELAYGDPAFIVDRHPTIFDRTLARGDALGVHPHAWRWDSDRRVWIGDHGDPAWVEACVDMSFEAYRSRFGEPARIHRFGSRFLSEAVLAAARGHGAVVDMTVEPGEPSDGPGSRMGGEWTGRTPDFVDAPRVPYRPDPADLQRVSPSTEGLWAIPLTSGRLVLHPRRVRRAARAARHPARASGPSPVARPPGATVTGRTGSWPCGGTGAAPATSGGRRLTRPERGTPPTWRSPSGPTPRCTGTCGNGSRASWRRFPTARRPIDWCSPPRRTPSGGWA
jgi:hypothetical protein